MLIIKNGFVIDPANNIEKKADIIINEGRICAVSDDPALISRYEGKAACDVIDAAGCIAAPALVDVHVHFRDPGFTYKEDIESGAKAAAAGGFGSVVLMANTKPAADNEETIKYVLEKGKNSPRA